MSNKLHHDSLAGKRRWRQRVSPLVIALIIWGILGWALALDLLWLIASAA